jgi:hypothetical protein
MRPPLVPRRAAFALLPASLLMVLTITGPVHGSTLAAHRVHGANAGSPVALVAAPIAQKPDARVRLAESGYTGHRERQTGPFVGNNVYNSTGLHQQSLVESFADVVGTYYAFDISIQNDGTHPAAFAVRATGTASRYWAIRYSHISTTITSAVLAGTFRTPTLAPGATYVIRATMSEKGEADISRLVTVRSTAGTSRVDAIKFGFKVVACGC